MIIVGIIAREEKLENKDIYLMYKNICNILFNYDIFPICIPNTTNIENTKKLIDLCDGIILQGGEKMHPQDITIAKYLYNNNIPTLGICLGMQTMAKAFNGNIITTDNHNVNIKYAHYIKIDKETLLYEILNQEYIFVNSHHHDIVLNTNLKTSATYTNVIEAVEDKTKKFYLGVQWHPEKHPDKNSDRIFKAFKNALVKNK